MGLMNESKAIGTRGEKSLHAALKRWYAQPGDQVEAMVDGYRVDIVREDLLIEIQTRNFSALKAKLECLLVDHPVRLVYPVAVEKWVTRLAADGTVIGRRKSPKRGRVEDVFAELIRLPTLMAHPRFTLQVLLIRAEEQRRNDGLGSWRRKGWSLYDHILLDVVEPVTWNIPQDLLSLLPPQAPCDSSIREEGAHYDAIANRSGQATVGEGAHYSATANEHQAQGTATTRREMPRPFTTTDLATGLRISKSLARKMAYCLHRMDLLEKSGKRGRSVLYQEKAP